MLKSYDKVLDNAAWIKQATIYKETTVTTKAKIFYFHGGGLLYGFRKDLPEKHITIRKDYQVDKVLDDETVALFGNQHTYTHVGINHFERG